MSTLKPSAATVLAAVAHPDDIEFMMAGTLFRLKDLGAKIYLWNLANGSCGTASHAKEEIIRIRRQEALDAAKLLDATMLPPIADDISLFYDQPTLAKVGAIVREVNPDIILTQSPQDYMEDHQNTTRLLVTAAFCRGMPNFPTDPPTRPVGKATALYHALPHGLRDGLRRLVRPGIYVDITPVLERKREMLAQHRSQKQWLDVSQGMDAYLNEMETMSRAVGTLSKRFTLAEGFRLHSHLGFGPKDFDPLRELLGEACYPDPVYQQGLNP
ncbi:MAG: PIG-L family deacetylase [Phycisphaeraceae bacterium]|nr:PIG-L family deacetylase [Phycisphaeraceae bacterium]